LLITYSIKSRNNIFNKLTATELGNFQIQYTFGSIRSGIIVFSQFRP
jgi:hypothetical protein